MNWIKERREALGLTQEQLVAKIQTNGYNVSRGTLSHWEMNKTLPPLHIPACANALSIALRMSVLNVLRAGGYNIQESSEKAKRAADLVNQLPLKEQDTALDLLEVLLKKATNGA